MSIYTTKTFKDTKLDHLVVVIDSKSIAEFQDLIHRGVNLFPDASAEVKEFADIVTNGFALQDYYRQSNTPKT